MKAATSCEGVQPLESKMVCVMEGEGHIYTMRIGSHLVLHWSVTVLGASAGNNFISVGSHDFLAWAAEGVV